MTGRDSHQVRFSFSTLSLYEAVLHFYDREAVAVAPACNNSSARSYPKEHSSK
jgi:hypothetical protein